MAQEKVDYNLYHMLEQHLSDMLTIQGTADEQTPEQVDEATTALSALYRSAAEQILADKAATFMGQQYDAHGKADAAAPGSKVLFEQARVLLDAVRTHRQGSIPRVAEAALAQ